MNLARPLSVLCSALAAAPALADCIDDAARHHGVNRHVLRAIGWHESRLQPGAVAVNRNGTRDLGAFQINSVHLPELARHGVDATALRDGCVSSHVAAWHLARQVARDGNTWQAVGAYHSRTPARAAWYANAIARVLVRWQVLPPGPPPFDPADTLAPTSPSATSAASARPARPLPSTVTVFDSPSTPDRTPPP